MVNFFLNSKVIVHSHTRFRTNSCHHRTRWNCELYLLLFNPVLHFVGIFYSDEIATCLLPL